ncbi:hypothetical protein FACS1894199_10610 [Bacteroidia bacterium]|nr:hypothetical protein FACS1894199_10610 [Bacteroidia bacterium]
MENSVKTLETAQKQIEKQVDKVYQKQLAIKPIYDGIVNEERYLKSKYRIAWFLKEAYNVEDGDWSMKDAFDRDNIYDTMMTKEGKPTFQPMAYVTYSLLNDFRKYNKIAGLREDKEIAQCLRQIALINVSKMPGASRSANLSPKYEIWKPVLLQQIQEYNPQILIFGYTFSLYQADLGINDNEIKHYGESVDYVVKEGKIYVNAYHPAQRKINREQYVQEIIDVIRKNIKSIQ